MGSKDEPVEEPVEEHEDGDDSKEIDDEQQKPEGSKRKRKRKRKKKSKDESEQVTEAENEEQEEEDETVQQNSVDCTVYVEGIPFDARPDDVKEFFESNGQITDILELRLPTWQDSGRLRGYGHIHFASQTSYDKALTLSGKHMGKRYLTIQPCNTPKGFGGGGYDQGGRSSVPNEPPPDNCRTLFVNNLPYAAIEEDIMKVFAKLSGGVDNIEGVRIARNSVNRQSKGFCYVDFVSSDDCHRVVKKAASKPGKRIIVGGRPVRIDYDTGRMKGSFRSETGRLYTKEAKEQQQQGSGGGKRRRT